MRADSQTALQVVWNEHLTCWFLFSRKITEFFFLRTLFAVILTLEDGAQPRAVPSGHLHNSWMEIVSKE